MRKDYLPIAIALLLPIFAFARAQETQTSNSQISDWRITEKEVKAVQVELTLRGYYKSKLSGVLDRDTRVAILSYQADNGLAVSGRIDQETYRKLNLTYPATGKESDRLRGATPVSKAGYEVKDATVGAGEAVSDGAKNAGSSVRGGLEKTWDAGVGAVSKSKDVARGAGSSTLRGVKSVGRAGARIFKRNDSDLQQQVRRLLEDNPETRSWRFEVKKGAVTIKTPPDHKADVGEVISNIRQIPGVESIFVVAL